MNSVEGRMQNTHKIQGHIRSTPKIQGNIRFGNVSPELEDLEIIPTEQEQNFKSTKYGYDEVKVKAIETEEKTATVDFSNSDVSEVTNTSGKYMKKVTINKDEDLIASNIKQGANIYGVEGGLEILDTSDATATDEDILIGRTAYVNNKKVTGTIQVKETVSGSTLAYRNMELTTDINVLDINSSYGVALLGNFNTTTLYIHKFEDGEILDLYDTIELSMFGTQGTLLSGQISSFLNSSGHLNIMLYAHVTGAANADVCATQFDIKANKVLRDRVAKQSILHSYAKVHAGGIAINPVYPDVWAVCNQHTSYNYCSGYVGRYDSVNNNFDRIVSISTIDYLNRTAYGSCAEWDNTGTVLYLMTDKINTEYSDIYTFTDTTFQTYTNRLHTQYYNADYYEPVVIALWNDTYYFYRNTLRKVIGGSVVKTYTEFSATRGETLFWTHGNYLFVVDYPNFKKKVFKIDEETLDLTLLHDFDLDSNTKPGNAYAGSIVKPISNHCMVYAESPQSNAIEFYYSDNQKIINSVYVKGATCYNTSDATVSAGDILKGEIAYTNKGEIEGTMPNNGSLAYTPTTANQTIPAGYTSGGTIAAVTSAIDSNILPKNIKKDVSILGVTGTCEASTSDSVKSAFAGEICNITNAVDNSLIEEFRVTGKSVQEGSPTPSVPIDIQNVEGDIEVKVTNGLEEIDGSYQEQSVVFPLADGQKLMKNSYLADDGIHHTRVQYVFTGTESISVSSWDGCYRASFYLSNTMKYTNVDNNGQLCNMFTYDRHATFTNGNEHPVGSFAQYRDGYFYLIVEQSTTNSLKAWLAEQYANGTPMILEYELATPEVVSYTADQQMAWHNMNLLTTYKNTTITTTNAVQPILSGKYYLDTEMYSGDTLEINDLTGVSVEDTTLILEVD